MKNEFQLTPLQSEKDDQGATEYETTYQYDENGNLWKVTDPFGGETIYTYDELDRLKTRSLPNGVLTTWDFDDRDRLLSIVHEDTNVPVNDPNRGVSSFIYSHHQDAVGEPYKITREDDSYVELDYDPALRLKEERHFADLGVLQHKITYTYDEAGNRTSKRVVEPGISVDDTYTENIDPVSGYKLTGVTATNGDDSTFAYDAGGRLITITREFQGASDTQTLSYNAAGQVTEVLDVGGQNVDYTYEYDALGRRVKESHGSTETNYLIAPAAQRLGAGALDVELQHLATDGNSDLRAGWIFAGENPIIRFYGTEGSETIEYYLEDGSDSIAAIIDDPMTGSVSKRAEYRYDGFGNNLDDLYPNPGEGTSSIPNLDGDFGFHAAWRDTETGLYHVRARTYDPETGRFTSPDPATPNEQVPETYHPYAFANSNPHLFSDPTGLFTIVSISVSSSIQSNLSSLKGAAVQQARRFATDQVLELGTQALQQVLFSFVPGGAIGDALYLIDNAQEAGAAFGAGVRGALCSDGLASFQNMLRFEVPINPTTGHPTQNGFGCGSSDVDNPHAGGAGVENLPNSTRKPIRPDLIIGPPNVVNNLTQFQQGLSTDASTYVSVEFKLSVTTLRREIKKSNRQITGIANYSDQHTIPEKIAVFVTLFERNKNGYSGEVEIARSIEKLQRHFGLVGIVHSLTGLTNPLRSRR